MLDDDFDLDAYLARIGYAGPRAPTLQVLRALHALHPAAIAFENLTPLMGHTPSLTLEALQAKLVRGGRGGYCYEQNGLFKAALTALGFQVEGLAGRVRWGAPESDPLRARSHMLLMIRLPEGRYLADVGFGGIVMTAPLALDLPDTPQPTPHERFRLASAPGGLDLQVELGEAWRTLYRLDLSPFLDADYVVMNLFTATDASSPFPKSLMAARALPDRRLALADARYTIRRQGEAPQTRALPSLAALAQVLQEDFGLILPAGFEAIGPKLGLS